jgi:hypothetical protein
VLRQACVSSDARAIATAGGAGAFTITQGKVKPTGSLTNGRLAALLTKVKDANTYYYLALRSARSSWASASAVPPPVLGHDGVHARDGYDVLADHQHVLRRPRHRVCLRAGGLGVGDLARCARTGVRHEGRLLGAAHVGELRRDQDQ